MYYGIIITRNLFRKQKTYYMRAAVKRNEKKPNMLSFKNENGIG